MIHRDCIYAVIAGLFTLATLLACKSSTKHKALDTSATGTQPPDGSAGSGAAAAVADASNLTGQDGSKLNVTKVTATSFPVGSQQLLLLNADTPGKEDFLSYEICPKASTSSCRSGNYIIGGQIIADLPGGPYQISVRACYRDEVALLGQSCGPSSSTVYQQAENPNDTMALLIKVVSEASTAIRALGPKIQTAYINYRDATYGKGAEEGTAVPKTTVDQLVETQLMAGETVIEELANSEAYEAAFKQFNPPAAPTAAPSTTTPAAGSTTDNSSSSEIDDLKTQWNTFLKSQNSNPAPFVAPPSSSNANAKVELRSILLTIATLGIITGAITTKIGFMMGEKLKADNTKIPDFDIFTEMSKVVDMGFAKVSDIMHNIGGFKALFTKSDLPKGLDAQTMAIQSSVDGPGSHITTYRSAGDDPVYFQQGDAFYRLGSTINELKGLTSLPGSTFTQKQFSELPEATQALLLNKYDVSKDENGVITYKWKDGYNISDFYFVTTDANEPRKLYQKEWPETLDKLTKFNKETVNGLYGRWVQLVQNKKFLQSERVRLDRPALTADDWAVGVPLFNDAGKLIEPPDNWKVAGKNWFWDPPQGNVLVEAGKSVFNNIMSNTWWGATYNAPNENDNASANNNAAPAPNIKIVDVNINDTTFKFTDTNSHIRTMPPTDQGSVKDIAMRTVNAKKNETIVSTDVAMQYVNQDIHSTIEQVRIKAAPIKENLQTQFELAKLKGENLSHYVSWGGTLLALSSVALISVTLGFSLTSQPLDDLLANLQAFETQLNALHQQRSAAWTKIQALLGSAAAKTLGDTWLYQL